MTDPYERALEDVDTTVAVVDGRVAMSADGEATLHVDTPDYTPLSVAEPHATLRISGDDYRATIELDGDAVAALRDAFQAAASDADATESESR